MKNNKIINCFFIAFFALSTSFKCPIKNCQLECVSTNLSGYVVLKIWDTKKGATYKLVNAKRDCIYAVLYSGLSENRECLTQPPLLNQIEERIEFQKIENSFFSKNGDWSRFVVSGEISKSGQNTIVNNCKVYQISISKDELRKYLESRNIIKSLNHGF